MIVDNLKNSTLYKKMHKDFAQVFEALKTISKDDGKLVLEEGNVWINPPALTVISNTEKVFEAHNDFIDIHYIISGAEKFGYASRGCLTVTKEYDKQGDYELLNGEADLITLKAGDFCIVFPDDAHIPAYRKAGDESLVRVVAKIRY